MATSSVRESLVSNLWVLISNVVILALLYEVLQDRAFRISYWESMGFTPHTSYTLFFYITSATKVTASGSTYIPGTLTLDWTQVLVLLLVVIDVAYCVGWLRRRSASHSAIPPEGPKSAEISSP